MKNKKIKLKHCNGRTLDIITNRMDKDCCDHKNGCNLYRVCYVKSPMFKAVYCEDCGFIDLVCNKKLQAIFDKFFLRKWDGTADGFYDDFISVNPDTSEEAFIKDFKKMHEINNGSADEEDNDINYALAYINTQRVGDYEDEQ